MNEDLFWSMIENAWKTASSMTKERQQLAQGKFSEEKAEELVEALEEVIPSLVTTLEQLSQDDLLTFDQILERKLFEIDRAEVQEQDHFRTGDYIVLKRPNVSTFIETLFEWFDVSV
jgi:hypothetical protein